MRRFLFLFVILSLALAACEGARNNTSWSKKDKDAEIVPSLKKAEKPVESAESATDSVPADSSEAHP